MEYDGSESAAKLYELVQDLRYELQETPFWEERVTELLNQYRDSPVDYGELLHAVIDMPPPATQARALKLVGAIQDLWLFLAKPLLSKAPLSDDLVAILCRIVVGLTEMPRYMIVAYYYDNQFKPYERVAKIDLELWTQVCQEYADERLMRQSWEYLDSQGFGDWWRRSSGVQINRIVEDLSRAQDISYDNAAAHIYQYMQYKRGQNSGDERN